jgi:hypothetical protein
VQAPIITKHFEIAPGKRGANVLPRDVTLSKPYKCPCTGCVTWYRVPIPNCFETESIGHTVMAVSLLKSPAATALDGKPPGPGSAPVPLSESLCLLPPSRLARLLCGKGPDDSDPRNPGGDRAGLASLP